MKYLLSQEEYDTLRLRKEDEIAEIRLNEHVETDTCGFDRNGSHSTGHYVCTCGWEDNSETLGRIYFTDPREDKSPPSKERVASIVSMMHDLGMYTQAREVQRLGDAYEAMKVNKG